MYTEKMYKNTITVEPLLRGHPDERPTEVERPFDNVNPNINVLMCSPEERSSLLKGHKRDGLKKGVPL